jgi:hypothetical protein
MDAPLILMHAWYATGDRRAYEGYTENMDIYHELGPNKWFSQPKGPRPMPQEWTAVAS